ncbi:acyltransferase family protein [Aeromicrobium sp.]|uniref:acyltransferase family protein n=1 Tax=Aeromicrobium sp. TaxID=1871063 RepID=UPI003C3DA315
MSDHGRTLRLDIEGMRTIAVGSVLAAHAGIPFLAGGFVGVDVFFVLSGFLITGLLTREVASSGRVDLANFWARRVRRLLPASATVLVFSTIVTFIYLPITQRQAFGGDIVSAALYVVNWRLADRGVDYLAEDIGQSPVQHYWSLAVEEQFYFLWPPLILAIGVLAARRWKHVAFGVLGLITAASFVYAVMQTASSPQTAYFVSTTRIWELGIGALLALSVTAVVRLPRVARAVGGWVGIAMIAYAVLFFDTSTAWPGASALVPTVGAGLLIASGLAATPGSPQRLLSLAPMVWIGGLSYSIYLWHWPMLVAAQATYPDLRLRWTVLLMMVSIVPAWLSHRLIENPIRFGSTFKGSRRALGMGAALTAIGVGVGFGLNAPLAQGDTIREASKAQGVGAVALADPSKDGVDWSVLTSVAAMRPLPADAPADRPSFYDDGSGCQTRPGDSKPKPCVSGDTTAARTLLIVGDSKIGQWQTVLDRLGRAQGWRLVQLTKSACPFADATITRLDAPVTDCREWGRAALADIAKIKPDLVLTSQGSLTALPGDEGGDADKTRAAMVDGLVSFWTTLENAGIPVAALLDNPAPDNAPVYECVAQHPKSLNTCAFDQAAAIDRSAAPVQRAAAAKVPGVGVIDLTSSICPDDGRCAPVIGNVLVYRQGSHLTRTYINSMEQQVSRALFRVSDGQFGAKR